MKKIVLNSLFGLAIAMLVIGGVCQNSLLYILAVILFLVLLLIITK